MLEVTKLGTRPNGGQAHSVVWQKFLFNKAKPLAEMEVLQYECGEVAVGCVVKAFDGLQMYLNLANQISALVVCKRLCFPHTLANKLTGLLLFFAVPTVFWSVIPIAIVAVLATFAAVQEGIGSWKSDNMSKFVAKISITWQKIASTSKKGKESP